MFSVFAEAIVKNVPVVKKPRVSVLRDGAAVAEVLSKAGTGYIEYEAVVVNTMRKASRGLERARKVLMERLRDFEGASDAARERVEDASGGNCWSPAGVAASVASFNRFLLRWGGSAATAGCDCVGVCVAENATVDCALLLSGAYDFAQK